MIGDLNITPEKNCSHQMTKAVYYHIIISFLILIGCVKDILWNTTMVLHRPDSKPKGLSLLSVRIILKVLKHASNVDNLKLFHYWYAKST